MLRSIEDMSTEETAECLDLSTDVVKTRLHRARGLLRRELLARAGTSVAALYAFAGERCDRIVAGVLARMRVKAGRAVAAGLSGRKQKGRPKAALESEFARTKAGSASTRCGRGSPRRECAHSE